MIGTVFDLCAFIENFSDCSKHVYTVYQKCSLLYKSGVNFFIWNLTRLYFPSNSSSGLSSVRFLRCWYAWDDNLSDCRSNQDTDAMFLMLMIPISWHTEKQPYRASNPTLQSLPRSSERNLTKNTEVLHQNREPDHRNRKGFIDIIKKVLKTFNRSL